MGKFKKPILILTALLVLVPLGYFAVPHLIDVGRSLPNGAWDTYRDGRISLGEIFDPKGNPFAHRFSDMKDIRTATYVIAASDSRNRYDCDLRCDGSDDDVQILGAFNALPTEAITDENFVAGPFAQWDSMDDPVVGGWVRVQTDETLSRDAVDKDEGAASLKIVAVADDDPGAKLAGLASLDWTAYNIIEVAVKADHVDMLRLTLYDSNGYYRYYDALIFDDAVWEEVRFDLTKWERQYRTFDITDIVEVRFQVLTETNGYTFRLDNIRLNTWVSLANTGIKVGSEVIHNGATYVEDTDYHINYNQGKIKPIYGGALTSGNTYKADYTHLLGGKVLLLDRQFNCDEFDIPSNAWLQGQSYGTVLFHQDTADTGFVNMNGDSSTLSDLQIYGNRDAAPHDTGCVYITGQNILVKNLWTRNGHWDNIYIGSQDPYIEAEKIVLDSCFTWDLNNGSGIELRGRCRDVVIKNCVMWGATDGGLKISVHSSDAGTVKGLVIEGCQFYGVANGLSNIPAPAPPDPDQPRFKPDGIIVNDCLFDHCGIKLQWVKNVQISNSEVKGAIEYGIWGFCSGAPWDDISNISVSNCIVRGVALRGIYGYIDRVEGCTIEECGLLSVDLNRDGAIVVGNTLDVLDIGCNKCSVIGNKIGSLYTNGDYSIYKGNTISERVYVYAGHDYNVFEGNILETTGSYFIAGGAVHNIYRNNILINPGAQKMFNAEQDPSNVIYEKNCDAFADIQAVSTTFVGSWAGTGAEQEINPGDPGWAAQPDVPRNLTVTCTKNDSPSGDVVIEGTDAKGNSISESFTIVAPGTRTGVKAFATISEITIPATVPAGETIDVGIGSKLGLCNTIYETSDVYKVTRTTGTGATAADYSVQGTDITVNAAYDTIDMATGAGIVAGDCYIVWYKTNLNKEAP